MPVEDADADGVDEMSDMRVAMESADEMEIWRV